MRISYDREADALLIVLRAGVQPNHGVDVAPGVTMDVDADGNIVALEVLDAAVRLGADEVRTIIIEHDGGDPAPYQPSSVDHGGYATGQPGIWLSIPEAARRVGVSPQAVRQAVTEGRLRGLPLRPGSTHRMVAEESLAAWTPDRGRQAAGRTRSRRR